MSTNYNFDLLYSFSLQDSGLINLSDWEWLFFLAVLILVIWLLIIFQAKSYSSLESGSATESDNNFDENSLSEGH